MGDIDAVWIDEDEPHLGPTGAKGIGELGIVGTAAASPTRSTTPPGSASATCRSGWTSCWDLAFTRDGDGLGHHRYFRDRSGHARARGGDVFIGPVRQPGRPDRRAGPAGPVATAPCAVAAGGPDGEGPVGRRTLVQGLGRTGECRARRSPGSRWSHGTTTPTGSAQSPGTGTSTGRIPDRTLFTTRRSGVENGWRRSSGWEDTDMTGTRSVRLGWLVAATASVLVAAGTPALAASAGSGPPPTYRAHDYAHGQALSILPPGENGLVNAVQLAQFEATGQRPPNSQDQLAPYRDLPYNYQSLTDGALSQYYNDESFGVPKSQITRVETPSPSVPVTIYRDTRDIPHVYGATNAALGLRRRVRPSRGSALPHGRAASLRRRDVVQLPRIVLCRRADGPQPAAAGSLHARSGGGPGGQPAGRIRRPGPTGQGHDRQLRQRASTPISARHSARTRRFCRPTTPPRWRRPSRGNPAMWSPSPG